MSNHTPTKMNYKIVQVQGGFALIIVDKPAANNEYSIGLSGHVKKFTGKDHVLWIEGCPKVLAVSFEIEPGFMEVVGNLDLDILNALTNVPDPEQWVADMKTENIYEIDFDGHVKCKLKVSGGKIEVIAAMNGYGNGIRIEEIGIHHDQ